MGGVIECDQTEIRGMQREGVAVRVGEEAAVSSPGCRQNHPLPSTTLGLHCWIDSGRHCDMAAVGSWAKGGIPRHGRLEVDASFVRGTRSRKINGQQRSRAVTDKNFEATEY